MRLALSLLLFSLSASSWAQDASTPPTRVEDHQILTSDADANDRFAWTVSIDGDRALAGAHQDDDAGADAGAAYVFEYAGGVWTQTAKLFASDAAAGDFFGGAVSLDGTRALVSSQLHEHDGVTDAGAAYVFDLIDGTWTQTAKLVADDPDDGDQLGLSLSLSGDRALLGSLYDDDAGMDSGSAYVFDLAGGVWSQTSKLTASDAAAGDQFGYHVTVSGGRALVGAPQNDDGATSAGSAYIFDLASCGASCTETQKLVASDPDPIAQFGISVSLSAERALIGAYGADHDGMISAGAAYVFDQVEGSWTQSAKLTASDAAVVDELGSSVSLDGDRALVSSFRDDDGGFGSGSAYVFDFADGMWTETTKLTASDASAGDLFSLRVSLSGDRALIGAALNDTAAGEDAGSAYVYDLGPRSPVDLALTTWRRTPERGKYMRFRGVVQNVGATPVDAVVSFEVATPGFGPPHIEIASVALEPGEAVRFHRIGRAKFYLPPDAPGGTYGVTVSVLSDGIVLDSEAFAFDLPDALAASTDGAASRLEVLSSEASPNPFRERTRIRYGLTTVADVDLRVYDALGREVAVLVQGVRQPGAHSAVFEAGDLPGGVYLWRLSVDTEVTTGQLALTR